MKAHSFLTRPRRIVTALLGGLVLLGGCGGGGASGPQVSSIVASNARYGATTTITVSGMALDEGIVLGIEGPCEQLTTVVGGSADTRQYTCDITAVGEFIATVSRAGGGVVGRVTVNVPPPRVEITTGKGSFLIELDPERAPQSARNFLAYVNGNFYNNVVVQAVYPGRGIMAGGYQTGPRVKNPTRAAIPLESDNGLRNARGTIGMFRGADSNSARATWYINTADNADLDRQSAAQPGYAVFGRVVVGLDVVDAISALPFRPDLATGLSNVPETEVVITDVTQTR
jgi:peptidyl-prolyl cis-trans isomerase A (cyclophilin A)